MARMTRMGQGSAPCPIRVIRAIRGYSFLRGIIYKWIDSVGVAGLQKH